MIYLNFLKLTKKREHAQIELKFVFMNSTEN